MKGEDMKRLRILLRKDQRTRQRPGQEGKKKNSKKKPTSLLLMVVSIEL
jgi:hypothetical protein